MSAVGDGWKTVGLKPYEDEVSCAAVRTDDPWRPTHQ